MDGLSIFLGAIAVFGMFFGQILLFAPLFDRWERRAKATEDAIPGQARLKAEVLARRLGEMVLRGVYAVAWLTGLLVLPLLFVIVHDGRWILLLPVFALTFLQLLVCSWTGRRLEALKTADLSQAL